MYKINYKINKILLFCGIIFLFVGIIITICFGVISYQTNKKLANLDSHVRATNIDWNDYVDDDGDIMYKPIYYYEVDNQEYICKTNISSSNINHSKKMVYYDSNNPSDCLTEQEITNSKLFLMFLIMPGIFIVLGTIFIIIVVRKKLLINKLAKDGILVRNIPCNVVPSNVTMNGIRIPKIKASYNFPDGITRELSNLYYDKILDEGNTCDLIYLETNYKKYYLGFNIEQK